MHHQSKVYIVDDHPIFRKGLAQLINEEKDLTVCGEAESVDEALRDIARLRPHMVIVDITLRDRSGLELVREISQRWSGLPVLVISMHDEAVYAERVLRAGALGYIMKEEMTGKVVQAIRQVLQGKIYASESMVETMLGKVIFKPSLPENPVEALSDRELEVFQLTGKGCGRKEIAEMLHVSVKTIGTYKENIKKKLDLKNSTELMKHAIEWVRSQAGSAGE